MKPSLSLRSGLLIGALLWTIGLVIMASALLIVVIEFHPRAGLHLRVHDFFKRPLVLVLGVFCMVTGFLQVRRGVSPINNLRSRLAGLHEGRDRRVGGQYPSEVQPLVNDLNALLENREQAVRRAIAKAGDLAHGLKTPLAVLAHEAERARAAGQPEVAAAVQQQVDRMRRQVEYHLAHARAAAAGASPGAVSSIRESADGLARALDRIYAERGIAIDVRVAADLFVRVQREDLDEMIGNLLDNACTWARAHVTINAHSSDRFVAISVEDDGSGLAPEMREAVLQRGVRADEASPGSGLGLAIVRDLAHLYGGSISLDSSPLGGLNATIVLPQAPHEPTNRRTDEPTNPRATI
ncbi:MAG TPA: HAMP domain-containing sensor histidine kinase [Vicinamibacterales bacterium]|nr:HAMP domain-containing sensor histidine kinase [Vicinamibacterales bacterium]